LAIYANGQTYFPLTDQVGTERARFASTGGIVQTCMSQPFGDNLQCTGTDSSPYKFGKLERDAESGDDHAQHRDYNSNPYRWLTPDPAGEKVVVLTDPQTWNLYVYSHDNPATDNDPTGLTPAAPTAGAYPACTPVQGDNAPCTKNESPDMGQVNNEAQNATIAAQNQSQTQTQQNQPQQPEPSKQPSWDPSKPLPDDPSKLGPDWKKNPDHNDPNGEEYVNDKTGEKIEWNKGRPGSWGPKADRGKDGWHYTPPGGVRGKQVDPGQVLKAASKVAFWTTVVAITTKLIEAAAEACAEGACW
jgi:RHS repeat-associated protein